MRLLASINKYPSCIVLVAASVLAGCGQTPLSPGGDLSVDSGGILLSDSTPAFIDSVLADGGGADTEPLPTIDATVVEPDEFVEEPGYFHISLTAAADPGCYSKVPTIFSAQPYLNICLSSKVTSVDLYQNKSSGTPTHTFTANEAYPLTNLKDGQNYFILRTTVNGQTLEQEQGLIYQPSTRGLSGAIPTALTFSLKETVVDDKTRSSKDDLMTLFLETLNSFAVQDYIAENIKATGCSYNGCAYYHEDKSGGTQHEISIRIRETETQFDNDSTLEIENNRLKLTIKGDLSTRLDSYLWGKITVLGFPASHGESFYARANSDFTGTFYATVKSGGGFTITGSLTLSNLGITLYDLGAGNWMGWIIDKTMSWFDLDQTLEDIVNQQLKSVLDDVIKDSLQGLVDGFFGALKYEQEISLAGLLGVGAGAKVKFSAQDLAFDLDTDVIHVASDVAVTSTGLAAPTLKTYTKSFYLPTTKALSTTPGSSDLYLAFRHALFNKLAHVFWKGKAFEWAFGTQSSSQVPLPVEGVTVSFLNPPIVHDPEHNNDSAFFASNVLLSATLGGELFEALLIVRAADLAFATATDNVLRIDKSSLSQATYNCSVLKAPAGFYSLPIDCVGLLNVGTPTLRSKIDDALWDLIQIPLPTVELGGIFTQIPTSFSKHMKNSLNWTIDFSKVKFSTKPYYPISQSNADNELYGYGNVNLAP